MDKLIGTGWRIVSVRTINGRQIAKVERTTSTGSVWRTFVEVGA